MNRQTNHVLFAIALLALAPAVAQEGGNGNGPQSSHYNVIGSVPQICALGEPQLAAGVPANNVLGLTGRAITISSLVDSSTLAVNPATFGVDLSAFCNYAHRLAVESQNNGMWRQGTTPLAQGFASAIPYTAQVRWADTNNTLQATAANRQMVSLTVPVNTPSAGQIELQFDIVAGRSNALSFSPLLAGSYSDTILVTVEPQ
jgi:hypothetical protein